MSDETADNKCFLCGMKAEVQTRNYDFGHGSFVECRRCGTYGIDKGAKLALRNENNFWLSGLTREHDELYGKSLEITKATLGELRKQAPTDDEKPDRFLKVLIAMSTTRGQQVKLEPALDRSLGHCVDPDELRFLAIDLQDQGLIEFTQGQLVWYCCVLPSGWNKRSIRTNNSEPEPSIQRTSVEKEDPQMEHKVPTAFVSYSWDDESHKKWVKDVSTRLRADGVDVTLDQWATAPGDRLPFFMENAVRENDYVLIVCTPNYKSKSDKRKGGVGYEGDIMTGEVHTSGNHRKFVPVLRHGDWNTAIPSWLGGKYGVDLSGTPFSEEAYQDLLTTLHNRRQPPPPLGGPPQDALLHGNKSPSQFLNTAVTPEFEPIRIVGVIIDEVGEPRNDGTPGSALYSVPLRLSRTPTSEWADLFVQTWDHPPRWTTSHRPGIAQIDGDRIVLTRTTGEEVRRTHRETLKLVLEIVNQKVAQSITQRQTAQQAEEAKRRTHNENVRRDLSNLSFE